MAGGETTGGDGRRARGAAQVLVLPGPGPLWLGGWLAVEWALLGRNVWLVDLDPQGWAGWALGLEPQAHAVVRAVLNAEPLPRRPVPLPPAFAPLPALGQLTVTGPDPAASVLARLFPAQHPQGQTLLRRAFAPAAEEISVVTVGGATADLLDAWRPEAAAASDWLARLLVGSPRAAGWPSPERLAALLAPPPEDEAAVPTLALATSPLDPSGLRAAQLAVAAWGARAVVLAWGQPANRATRQALRTLEQRWPNQMLRTVVVPDPKLVARSLVRRAPPAWWMPTGGLSLGLRRAVAELEERLGAGVGSQPGPAQPDRAP